MAAFVSMVNFTVLTYLPENVDPNFIYAFFIMHGICMSLFLTAFWPCIKFVVPSGMTTTAYGLTFSIQNALLFLGPSCTGIVIDATEMLDGGYFWATLFFALLSIASAIMGGVVLGLDLYKGNGVLYKGEPDTEIAQIQI